MALSVVIPTFNEENRIRQCLTSVLGQLTEHRYEVIVVDSSDDATPEIVRSEFPGVRLFHREEKTIPGRARNIGVQHAEGSIIAFIDADCIAEATWVDTIVQVHEGKSVLVGGSISLSSPATLAGAMLFAVEFSQFLPRSHGCVMPYLPSCNLSVRRQVFVDCGGFPEEMEASEDMLFCRTLALRSGTDPRFEPKIRVDHVNVNQCSDVGSKLLTLGYWSGRSRASGLLPGGFLGSRPGLVPLLVPFRLVRILTRLWMYRGHKKLAAMSVLCWPLLVYGLSWWAVGFKRGITMGGDREPRRPGPG